MPRVIFIVSRVLLIVSSLVPNKQVPTPLLIVSRTPLLASSLPPNVVVPIATASVAASILSPRARSAVFVGGLAGLDPQFNQRNCRTCRDQTTYW